jgi:hypothetical protein
VFWCSVYGRFCEDIELDMTFDLCVAFMAYSGFKGYIGK